jgi:hypothetical protein
MGGISQIVRIVTIAKVAEHMAMAGNGLNKLRERRKD